MERVSERNQLRQSGLAQVHDSAQEARDQVSALLAPPVLLQQHEAEPLFESVDALQRRRGSARLKARGLRIAGAVPFGYDADPRSKQFVPNAIESVVVKWLFEQAAAGRTPADIADDANANGWRTKERVARRSAKAFGVNLWTACQVIATLRNPVYLSLFREKHDLRIGHHDPIITHALFAAAVAQLETHRTREPGKQYTIDWPLKGRIVCAVCERPMSPQTIRYRNFIYRYYRCRSTAGGRKPCGHQVSAPAIENSIEANVTQQPGQGSPIGDLIEVVMWDYRDSSVRVRLLPPVEAEQAQGR